MKNQKAFSLIELLIVIAIIGLLSSIVLVGISQVRKKSRDARRIADLDNVRKALMLYYIDHGNWMENGSGCGYEGAGTGWFNYEGGVYYVKSSARCLKEGGYIPVEIKDPTGGTECNFNNGYAYMKYFDSTTVYLFAKLETLPQSLTATDGTACQVCDSLYGMNYVLKIMK